MVGVEGARVRGSRWDCSLVLCLLLFYVVITAMFIHPHVVIWTVVSRPNPHLFGCLILVFRDQYEVGCMSTHKVVLV